LVTSPCSASLLGKARFGLVVALLLLEAATILTATVSTAALRTVPAITTALVTTAAAFVATTATVGSA
jgi:hypothetical protein